MQQLLEKYQNHFHPLSLLKYLEVTLFRLQEQEVVPCIYDFLTAATQVFGSQIALFVVQKYSDEDFILEDLLQLLISQFSQFGF